MRILYVLPQIYPYFTGGAEIFHYHLLIQMARKNKVGYIGYDNINSDAVKFYRLFKLRPLRFTIPLQTIILIYRLRNEFDIIHLSYCQGSWLHWFYLPILKKLFKINYGLTIHDPSLYEWKQKRIFKYVFDEAYFIVAVSERLKEGYEKRCSKAITYLPPLVPLNRYLPIDSGLLDELGIRKDCKIVLFAGSLKKSKRPLILAKAIDLLVHKWLGSNNLVVLFAGIGEQEEELRNYITKSTLEKHCILLGRIPQESLAKYYAMATLYVIPSIHEGKSMSLIEAMFNSLPIVASNAPGINDIIFDNQNGLLFEIDDVDGLAHCIRTLIEDCQLAMNLAHNAFRDYEGQFRFEDMYNCYMNLYENTRSS
jgi:glycosyltransferase involved in cell wall biosynthesis